MKFFDRKFGIFEIALSLILLYIFWYMTMVVHTDIPLHAQFIREYSFGNKPFPANFLYYFFVYTLTFFSPEPSSLLLMSIYVLAFATMAKYIIGKRIFYSEFSESHQMTSRGASIASALLVFTFSLPSIMITHDLYYLLSYPPNVWHNSTTIFAMPFVLLLFWQSVKQLQEHKTGRLLIIGILIVLNVWVKPSYLFVYFAIYPLLLLRKYRFSKLFWLNIAPIAVASILLFIEYYMIYVSNNVVDRNVIKLNPFSFVKTWAQGKNIGLVMVCTFISSFLFPIVLLVKNRRLFKEVMIEFAVYSMILAILISNFVAELGTRASHGNFLWQTIMCSYVLLFACLYQLLKLSFENPRGWKAYIIEYVFFSLHVVAGIIYFCKIVITNSYF